jgi:hypothetical protein
MIEEDEKPCCPDCYEEINTFKKELRDDIYGIN